MFKSLKKPQQNPKGFQLGNDEHLLDLVKKAGFTVDEKRSKSLVALRRPVLLDVKAMVGMLRKVFQPPFDDEETQAIYKAFDQYAETRPKREDGLLSTAYETWLVVAHKR